MIKVFNNTQEYNSYATNGLQSGDLYYVLDDGSVHFRTNNIDGEDKVYDKGDGGGSASTDTKITIGFRNTGNLYGLALIHDGQGLENIYLGETNLGTVANTSYNEGFEGNKPNGYLQTDGSIDDTPDNQFVSDREITWVKLNGEKVHTFESLPESLEISLMLVAFSKDGVKAPLVDVITSITLPNNIEGKNCILVYDFIPNTTNNTYFQLNEDNSFII
jgi:hypothetical protein